MCFALADHGVGTIAVSVTNSAGTSNAVSTTLGQALQGLSVVSGYVSATAAEAGGTIALYGTGFGAATSPAAVGVVFTGAYETTNPVTVTIGGISAQITWTGLIGPGLWQINVRSRRCGQAIRP